MAGLALRAAPAGMSVIAKQWLDFCVCKFGSPCELLGCPENFETFRMVKGQGFPHLSKLKCMKNGSQYKGIDGTVAGRCVRVPS